MSITAEYGHGNWVDLDNNSSSYANRCGDSGIQCDRKVVRYTDEDGNQRTKLEYVYSYDYSKFYSYKLDMSESWPPITSRDPQGVKTYYDDLLSRGINMQEARKRTFEEYIIPTYNPEIKTPRGNFGKPRYTQTNRSSPTTKSSSSFVKLPSSVPQFIKPSDKFSKAGLTPQNLNGLIFVAILGVVSLLIIKRNA